MRWPAVLRAITLAVQGDTTLSAIYGSAFRKGADAQTYTIPSLEYSLIASGISELWEPHVIQFTQHVSTMAALVSSESALMELFDHELPQTIEGVYMWSTYLGGDDLPGPSRESYYGRVVRFEFTPIRSRLIAGRS